jgi:predicted molibdopterin-dependent oxidoreductase YjgC
LSAAEVILPPLPLNESEGTITNIEGRVSSLSVPNTMRSNNKQGKDIISEISMQMGYPMSLNSIDEITREIS